MNRRVIILGAGVIGLSAAHYCLRRGLEVTVVDRHGPRRDGCSFGNAGMIVPSHFIPLAAPGMVKLGLKWMWNPRSPFYIKPRLSWDLVNWCALFCQACSARQMQRAMRVLRDLHLASRALYEELATEDGGFEFSPRGLTMLCRTRHALDDEARTAEQARRLGVPAGVLDSGGIAALDPGIRAEVCGGVHYPLDCHLSPQRLMAFLHSQLVAGGCRFLWNTRVTALQSKNGRIIRVRTSDDDLEGDEIVLAQGIWSQATARSIGLFLPMQAGKGYSVTLPEPRQRPRACAILVEARVAVTPLSDGLRFGGTMEIAGLDESVTSSRVSGIVEAATRYYPDFQASDFEAVRPWQGLRPCAPDGLPYLGRTAGTGNLIVATGHAMMGVSLAPVTGKIVAQLVAADLPGHDLRLLSPDRYGMRS